MLAIFLKYIEAGKICQRVEFAMHQAYPHHRIWYLEHNQVCSLNAKPGKETEHD